VLCNALGISAKSILMAGGRSTCVAQNMAEWPNCSEKYEECVKSR
jgi:hypothetical protein